MLTNFDKKSNTVHQKQNCTLNSFENLATVLLVDIRDRLLAQVELINEELARRGERTESESYCVADSPPVATQQISKSPRPWLNPTTRLKKRKDGTTAEYPQVEGVRGTPESNPEHYYWALKWRSPEGKIQTKYFPLQHLNKIRKAIATNGTPAEIIRLIKGDQVDA